MGFKKLMNFFYLDKEIKSIDLKEFSGQSKFSELSIQKSSLSKILKSSIDSSLSFKKINSIQEIETDHGELILWHSNMIFKNKEMHNLFLKKLLNSYFSLFYGSDESFIFKGYLDELKIMLNPSRDLISSREVIKLEPEENIIIIDTKWDLKKLALYKPHTRHFNKLEIKKNTVIKESVNKEKIIDEFNFLSNIPEAMKNYYVTVSDLKVQENLAQYSMNKVNGLDLSMEFINNGLSSKMLSSIFNELKVYFELIQNYTGSQNETTYDFLVNKNHTRLSELKAWNGYQQLNEFARNHTPFSCIDSLFDSANRLLKNSKTELNSTKAVISHGDLCFSNIIKDDDQLRLIFIDPRGGKISNNYRSPYYDLAKLCHSLLGGYDHIVNDIAEIKFNNDMLANIKFGQDMDKHKELFQSFVASLSLSYFLVRKVEISLFLSMLPLHTESSKKVSMLMLRASELILSLEK
jgi:hypothetical protein